MPALIIALISAVIAAAGTGISYEQQRKQASQMEDNKNREAALAKEKAADDAEIYTENARRLIAQQRANFAASGFEVDSGSPLTILAESAETAQRDRDLIIKYGSWSEETAHIEAGMYDEKASNAALGNVFATGGTLLGGVSKAVQGGYQSGALEVS